MANTFDSFRAEITDALFSGKGVSYILAAAGKYLKNPILLVDESFHLVDSVNTDYPEDEFLQYIVKNLSFPRSYVEQLRDDMRLSEMPHVICREDKPGGSPNRYFVVDIALPGRFFGFLSIVEEDEPITPEEKEKFEFLGQAVTTELRSRRDPKAGGTLRLQDYVLHEMLEGKLSGAQLDSRLELAKLDFRYGKRLLRITGRFDSAETVRLEFHIDSIRTICGNQACVIYDDAIVVLTDEIPNGGASPRLLDALREYMDRSGLVCGVSDPTPVASEIPEIYRQAKGATVFGQFIFAEKSIYIYENLSIYHMIDCVSRTTSLKSFCSPHYMYMLAYDKQFNTDYAPTIVCYLENLLDLSKTAADMKVHRNTIVYRIKRIEDIFHFDFSDAEQVFSMLLTFRVFRSISSLDYGRAGKMLIF